MLHGLSILLLVRTRQDVAESIGIGNLTDDISSALAADVEYRLREVIEVGELIAQLSRSNSHRADQMRLLPGVAQVYASRKTDALEGRGRRLCAEGPEH